MKNMYLWCSLMAALLFGMTNVTAQNLTVEGNVGIGIATPTERLDVNGSGRVTGNLGIGTIASRAKTEIVLNAALDAFAFQNLQSNEITVMTIFNDIGNSSGQLGMINTSSDYLGGGNQGDLFLINNAPHDLILGTNGLDRMRITAAGDLGIGTKLPSQKLDVDGRARIRNLPTGSGTTVVADTNGNLFKSSSSPNVNEQRINALQEENEILKAELEEVKNQFAALKQMVESIAATTSPTISNSAIITSATLQQNAPNPFDETTTIKYFIPETVKSASLQVMDQNGRIIKTIPIQASGQGQLTLQANLLSAGTYSYALILDGQLMETKQMVLTH